MDSIVNLPAILQEELAHLDVQEKKERAKEEARKEAQALKRQKERIKERKLYFIDEKLTQLKKMRDDAGYRENNGYGLHRW